MYILRRGWDGVFEKEEEALEGGGSGLEEGVKE